MIDNMSFSCEELRELARDNPEQAAVIMEMMKAAGEDCEEYDIEAAISTEH